MCLTEFKKVTLKEDKVVYKVLACRKADTRRFVVGNDEVSVCYKYEQDTYESPYSPFPWKRGVRATAEKSEKYERPNEINSGYFHSFEYVQDAIVELSNIQNIEKNTSFILGKFTIPKDTEVYKGYYGCSYITSYCSKEIIFNDAFVLDDFDNVRRALSYMSISSYRVWYEANEREFVVNGIKKSKAKLDYWKEEMKGHHNAGVLNLYHNGIASCEMLIKYLNQYLEWYDKGMFNIV